MARIRKAVAYRRTERPYTRVSKFRKKTFIKANPPIKIVRFNMGNLQKDFEYKVHLVAKDPLQIRHNAFESARQTSNRVLEKGIGTANYSFRINVYPHHVQRENPLAAGAGADRFSTGMKHSFGKPIGRAALIKKGQKIITISVDKNGLSKAKEAMKRAASKLPMSYYIQVENN